MSNAVEPVSCAAPNIVIIHTDQHRSDCLGIVGRREVETSNLDALAQRGARFEAAYATTPVCIPQRLSLLTGQLASTHGVRGNIGIPKFPMPHSLPRELARGGYQTALVGRTFHTFPADDPVGFEHYVPGDPSSEMKEDFDHFFAYLREHAPTHSGGYYGNGASNNSTIAAPFHLPDHLHHTHWTSEEALRFLSIRDTERPFFLTVGYYAPHGPLNPPQHFFERYHRRGPDRLPAISETDVPPVAVTDPSGTGYVNLGGEHLRSVLAGYYGNITFADLQIGRVLLALASVPNTYIIFTADHGEQLGDHYLYHKSRPYEGASHIPFLIAGPGIDPLQVRDEPVGWHDILPTVLDLAGLPIPDGVDGRSIAPLVLASSDQETSWRTHLHCENSVEGVGERMYPRLPGQRVDGNLVYEPSWHSVTDGKWKYIWWDQSGREQLFNLTEDPDELHDLATDTRYSEQLALWRGRLAADLEGRPEGWTVDGRTLVPGRPHPRLSADALKLVDQRLADGMRIGYYRAPLA